MIWFGLALLAALVLVLAWNVAPLVMIWRLPDVPREHKVRACYSMLDAAAKGLKVLLPDLLAPIVVAIALLQTKREDDHLPAWAWRWDNDVSINGDRPEYWRADYDGTTYYADAHPRSFKARWIWLGLRNRASALSLKLGHTYTEADKADREHWGDHATGRDHEGWTLNRAGKVYQLYVVKRLKRFPTLCRRTNYGHKIWTNGDDRPVAMVVNITVSLVRWQGKQLEQGGV